MSTLAQPTVKPHRSWSFGKVAVWTIMLLMALAYLVPV
jgi:hypothetical protein